MGFHTKPTTFVGHVTLKVADINRSLQFYQKILGFDILEQTNSTAQLTTDGQTSILSLNQPENVESKHGKTTGLYHFAILLPERADLANIVVHLRENGIYFGSSDHLVSEALYLTDPDGNGIEIYIDRDPSEWNWQGEEVAMTVDPLNFEDLLTTITSGNRWQGMPEGTIMGHIHLHVSELEKAEEFYVQGLGFDVVNRYGEQALFLSTEKYHHHIGMNTWNGVGAPSPSPNSVGLDSYTLILEDEEKRNRIVNNLKKIGADVFKENDTVLTVDPSGNRLKLEI